MSYQQIQKYERGANRISASMLYRLAQILRCNVGVLFEGIDAADTGKRGARVSQEDARAARSLDRIEDPVVKHALRGLIVLLDGAPKGS